MWGNNNKILDVHGHREDVRLKLAFCTTCVVRVLVLAQGPSFRDSGGPLLEAKRGFTR